MRALLGCACLLALVSVGSAGCGCGDDNLLPPGPGTCCCEIEWSTTAPGFQNIDLRIDLVGADPTLGSTILPRTVPQVSTGDVVLLQLCARRDHRLGAPVEVRLVDVATGGVVDWILIECDTTCMPSRNSSGGFGTFTIICPWS